jgi:hypothetical protein
LSSNFIFLCKQKYSSNVTEKLFDIKNKAFVTKFANLICNDEQNILELMSDQYGNYIIQKIIESLYDYNNDIIQKIIYTILSNVKIICQTSFGKTLLNKLSNKYLYFANVLTQQGLFNNQNI